MYNGNDSYGYDLVKFETEPYMIQKNSNKYGLKSLR